MNKQNRTHVKFIGILIVMGLIGCLAFIGGMIVNEADELSNPPIKVQEDIYIGYEDDIKGPQDSFQWNDPGFTEYTKPSFKRVEQK